MCAYILLKKSESSCHLPLNSSNTKKERIWVVYNHGVVTAFSQTWQNCPINIGQSGFQAQ